ncbi:MAG TPA: acyltransferase [Acidimicrobiales bacterium]|jgi:acetyltransferase-like isoleucine patch superfamily enzyme|nr:acyltransferase [Acidimicrobiales bacterium]
MRGPARSLSRRSAQAWIQFRAGLEGATVDVDIHPTAIFEALPSVAVEPGTHSRLVIGPSTRFERNVRLNFRGGSLHIADFTDVRQGCIFTVGGAIDIGSRCLISAGIYLHCSEQITIGDDTIIGEYSTLVDSMHLRTPPTEGVRHAVKSAPLILGRNIWVGTKVTLTSGITVGDQSFVAGNSVVTRDVAPWTLVGGVPARPLKQLEVSDDENEVGQGSTAQELIES